MFNLKSLRWLPRLSQLKVGQRLALGFSLVTVLLVVALASNQYEKRSVQRLNNEIFDVDFAILDLINVAIEATGRFSDSTTAAMESQGRPEVVSVERKNSELALAEVNALAEKINKIGVSGKNADMVTELATWTQTARTASREFYEFLDQKRLDEAQHVLSVQAEPAFSKMQEILDDARKLQAGRAQAARENIKTALAAGALVDYAVSAVALALTVLLSVLISRSIVQPLRALEESIRKVREGGDIAALAHIDSKDEMADIGFSVNQLLQDQISARERAEEETEALNNSVIAILQAVNQLSQRDLTAKAPVTPDVIGTVSDSINALTDETSRVLRGVTNIAGEVQQVSNKVKTRADLVSKTAAEERVSVNLMVDLLDRATKTMVQVAEMAQQSDRDAELATRETEGALETVNDTIKDMDLIRETIAETEKRIKRLGERSQEISGIVNLINTISERTHVLALNAAMQAAVAGDAGRGFAVVAEEVQRLAESSRAATQQIATLVGNIQLETNETIGTVNRTISQVVHGSEQAQKAGNQMRRTQAITATLVAQVRRIAESSELQRSASAQLLQSVQEIGQSTERTARQIVAQKQEADTLLLSARRLVESVDVFKLPVAAAAV